LDIINACTGCLVFSAKRSLLHAHGDLLSHMGFVVWVWLFRNDTELNKINILQRNILEKRPLRG